MTTCASYQKKANSQQQIAESQSMGTTSESVMLVSAELETQAMVQDFCSHFGASVSIITTLKDGFAALGRDRPSLFLIDFELPDNGALAIRRMAAKRVGTSPVILISPPNLEEEWVQVFECDGLVSKPVTKRALATASARAGWMPNLKRVQREAEDDTEPTVFDRVSSKPRLQPYRVRPAQKHSDVVDDTTPIPEIFAVEQTNGLSESGREVVGERRPTDDSMDGSMDGSNDEPRPHPTIDAVGRAEKVLAALWPRCTHEDPHYVLDVPRNASLQQVRQKFRRIRRDLRAGMDDLPRVSKRRADHLLVKVKIAYDAIVAALVQDGVPVESKPKHGFQPDQTGEQRLEALRRFSRRQVDLGKADKEADPVRQIDPGPHNRTPEGYAKAFFREARQFAAVQKWPEAFTLTQEALEKTPHNPELIAFDAWVLMHVPTPDPNKMLETCASRLSIALTLSDHLAEANYFLGRVRERQALTTEASTCYRRALELDPRLSRHKIAERIRDLQAL